MTPALTCQELVEVITNYLEDKLSTTERLRFEDHLAVCQGCRNYVAQMRYTIKIAGSISEEAIPTESKNELLALFKNWKANDQS